MSQRRAVRHVDVDPDELRRRLAKSPLCEDDKALFRSVIETLALLTHELESKRVSIARLRRIVFGARTEKLRNLTPQGKSTAGDGSAPGSETPEGCGASSDAGNSPADDSAAKGAPEHKPKGHGRHGVEDYTGARRRHVPHSSLRHGDTCPSCRRGKVCDVEAMVLIRLHGAVPVEAERIECDRLRCALCGEVFVADAPDDVGSEKYDEAAMAIVSLLKCGAGFPFNRLAKLQLSAGVPLAPSTQWELCETTAVRALPVFLALVSYAAQGRVLHTDDTYAKILGPVRRKGESKAGAVERVARAQLRHPHPLPTSPPRPSDRSGTFTNGIVSLADGHSVVLYRTGWQHAGDNLRELLSRRKTGLERPIQMSDALNRNMPPELETIVANCLAHARREFVDLVGDFEKPCLHVIRQLAVVYHNDSEAKKLGLSPEQRLAWHQERSAPVMLELQQWMQKELDDKRIEPNSTLGSAIKYMNKHWKKLTLFLCVAGAPLDNNLCERILKRAILHRKGSLFFRTERGSIVADICMSLIQTAEMSKKNPLHYLTSLLENHERVAAAPGDWLPWNYEQTLASLHDAAA